MITTHLQRAAGALWLSTCIVAAADAQQATVPRGRLTVHAAVRRALDTHPAVQAAGARVDAAAAGVGEARSAWFPQLAIEATVTRFQQPMIVAPLHAFDISRQPQFDRTLVGGRATFGYHVYDGGARGARIRARTADAEAATFEEGASREEIVSRVVHSYLEVLTARGVLNAHDRRIAALRAERERVDQLLAAGTAARVALLRVDAALASADAEQVVSRTRLDVAERTLARTIGADTAETRSTELVAVTLAAGQAFGDRHTLVQQADEANQLLERARARQQMAEANRRTALAAWLPGLRQCRR
jgi:outer membrane protein TolC